MIIVKKSLKEACKLITFKKYYMSISIENEKPEIMNIYTQPRKWRRKVLYNSVHWIKKKERTIMVREWNTRFEEMEGIIKND